MKNKFLLGAVAGISSLAIAVPILAQVSSAQNTVAPTPTQQSIRTETADGANETPDAPADPSLAKITQDAAKAAALSAQPGTVQSVTLENDDGALVYKVLITDQKGTVMDVSVDATTGKVLHVEKDDDQDNESVTDNHSDGEINDDKEEGNEAHEQNEPAGLETND